MAVYYVGITIGPIFDTISEASSPAALWFASTMFSDITRRICIGLKDTFQKYCLYSPAFDSADEKGLKDGVGKYHDRIIFSVDMELDDLEKNLCDMIEKVKEDTILGFWQENDERFKNFLKEYLQIRYVILDETQKGTDNLILVISPYLDALETMKTFPGTNAFNPIAKIMAGKPNARNELIKKSLLFKKVDPSKNQMLIFGDQKEGIWEIDNIADGTLYWYVTGNISHGEEYKYASYYAVVSADADGMGKLLQTLDDEKTVLFSEKCLQYSKEAAKLIQSRGGMTIYAGGDDLLFLAPVRVEDHTVFDLCQEIAGLFQKIVKESITLSFGISVQYYKYPLNRALDRSFALLSSAKDYNGKNAMAINIEKHSGQSAGVLVGNESFEIFDRMIQASFSFTNNHTEILKSIASSIEKNYPLLKLIDEKYPDICSSWKNMFDNDGQKDAEAYLNKIHDIYYDNFVEKKDTRIKVLFIDAKDGSFENLGEDIKTLSKSSLKRKPDEKLDTLLAVLRISKFLSEKAGEED